LDRPAEFLFITECLQQDQVMKHIKEDLGIKSAFDIEQQSFFGKKDEKEKHLTFKIYV